MAFDVTATLQAILSYAQASGYFDSASIGEPVAPPDSLGLHAAVIMRDVGVTGVYLNGGTRERHNVTLRIYRNMMDDKQATELELAQVVQKVVSDLLGDYDLGATIREVDAGGMNGPPLSSTWGYVELSHVMFRIVDVQLPLNVDDSATAAP